MDIAMHEWLTVIIVLLIVGILLDGYRRMRQSRKNSLRMSLSMHRGTQREELEDYGSELPSGGARVVHRNGANRNNRNKRNNSHNSHRDDSDCGNTDLDVGRRDPQVIQKQNHPAPAEPAMGKGCTARAPEQVKLNLGESVPMLMESVTGGKAEKSALDTPAPEQRIEPKINEDFAAFDTDVVEAADENAISELNQARTDAVASGQVNAESNTKRKPAIKTDAVEDNPVKPKKQPSKSQPAPSVDVEEVLVMNIMAPQGQRFNGVDLLDTALICGMRFGAMNIFHCHEDADGEGEVLFSMANMVVPGTFDLHAMEAFETPGVSLFLTLPLATDSLRAFNRMVESADVLCKKLGGELKDENRSVMTLQTIEHCRQRIKEFERKQLSRAPA